MRSESTLLPTADPPKFPRPTPPGEPTGKPAPPPADEMQESESVLIGGGPISSQVDSTFIGTLTTFVQDVSAPGVLYALTCLHVLGKVEVTLDASGQPVSDRVIALPTRNVTRVGQVNADGSCSGCSNDTFGTYAGGELVNRDWRDVALVRLDPGRTFYGEAKELGVVNGIAPRPTATEITDKSYLVRKYGHATGCTGGRVVKAQKVVSGQPAQYLVVPHPRTGIPYPQVHFGVRGDSGGPVLTPSGFLLGYVTGTAVVNAGEFEPTATGTVNVTFVTSIEAILHHLAALAPPLAVKLVDPRPAGEVRTVPPAPATTALLDDDVVTISMPPSPPPRPAGAPVLGDRLREDLSTSAFGREVLGLWQRHSAELTALVNYDRRVLVTWHRSGASAVFQRLARTRGLAEAALPSTVNGAPLRDCVDRMYSVLSDRGGPELRASLDQVRARLPELAGLTYPRILAAFDAVHD
ncbi:hypothetical protein [Saccharothrix yanglingensis]|uniref:Serine protease n=1 Tax=Saccharothrix yanglingensis TaxID=659496 RepID=A0ABU0X8D5_9PSEU|nr:hypothetical protein [Saccharothrix yanglingensis]MDQ2588399.1 hypothetical protein [Saccharothrix yanglingensis]